MIYFWIGCALIFGGIEAMTFSLVSVWFIAGSLAALVAAALGAQIWLQVVLFVVVSAVVLLLLRPFVKKYVDTKKVPTNADRVIGAVAIVTEDIDNVLGTGSVSVDGKSWTARSLSGEKVSKGSYVRPVSIQGVKLIVDIIKQED